jgi:GNAT superfamily N-acetyltransferase
MAEGQCVIREADLQAAGDCRAIVELIDMIDMYAREPMGGGRPLSAEVCQQLPARLAEQPQALVLLAEMDGCAAGVAVCFPSFSTFAAQPLINIHDLAVAPQYRGRGIGYRLYRRFGFVGGSGITPGEASLFWKKAIGKV